MNSGSGNIYKLVSGATTSVYRFNYWGAPVNNGTTYNLSSNLFINTDVNNLETNTTPTFITGLNGSGTSISKYWLYNFENALGWSLIDENTDLEPGLGFTMKGIGAAVNYNFIGTPNNGEIRHSITTNNYSLLSNPYPSVIDADAFNTTNLASNATTGTIYFWDQPSGVGHYKADYEGGYAIRAGGIGTPASGVGFTKTPDQYISIGQGFFVTGGTSGGDIVFDNSLRSTNTTSVFFKGKKKKSQTLGLPIVRVGFEYETGVGTYHRQIVASPRGKTTDFDIGYDAAMFDNFSNDMYWATTNESRLAINALPDLEYEMEIPLGVTVEGDKNVKIQLDALENIDIDVYLLDKETFEFYNLLERNKQVYLNTGTYTERFSIVLKERLVLGVEDEISNDFYVYQKEDILHIISSKFEIYDVKLYSLLGQLLSQNTVKVSTTHLELDSKKYNPGIYILRLKTNKGEISKKIRIQ